MPFKFWSFDHWMGSVPALFTPATTIGFLISVMGFLRASMTDKARDPTFGSRSTDPNPTERVVKVGGAVMPVPPVTPGRPLDPDAPKP